ncbi:hypothetical protein BD310DRAFT_884193 [Dichomitus squalens]|uniref:Uncharacterized protein n=1 Tax=Dichomitus squalens TaxID=114155 RepID=A0A4Q9PMM3_9APHY|nr:hypothetical protein BD310DRAFT_884193 [Dichomitus squalens]
MPASGSPSRVEKLSTNREDGSYVTCTWSAGGSSGLACLVPACEKSKANSKAGEGDPSNCAVVVLRDLCVRGRWEGRALACPDSGRRNLRRAEEVLSVRRQRAQQQHKLGREPEQTEHGLIEARLWTSSNGTALSTFVRAEQHTHAPKRGGQEGIEPSRPDSVHIER